MKDTTYDLPEKEVIKAISKKLNTTDFELKSFNIKLITEKHGLLCEHAHLKIKFKENETNQEKDTTFFVKYFPKEEKQAKFAESTGAFKKEIFIYELYDIFKRSNVNIISDCIAICYLSKHNDYLIFDNLNEEGLKMISKHEYLDEETLLVILDSLAKLHAASLCYEEYKSKELGREYRLIEDYEENLKESFNNHTEQMTSTLNGIIGSLDLFNFPITLENGANFKEEITKIYPEVLRFSEPSKKYRNVVCHGDLWSSNFLIKFNQGQPIFCKFVDFQCARYAPPAHDVLFLLYLTTSRKFRHSKLYNVLGMYYSYLEKHIEHCGLSLPEILPFNLFLESCEEQKKLGILSAAVCLNLILVNNNFLEKIVFNDEEMYHKCFVESRSHLVKAYMGQDENYRIRIEESLADLKELCENIN